MQKPHTGIPTHAPTRYPKTGLQHAPPSHRHIHPTFLSPPSSFPLSSFSQGATSHALGKQTSTEQLQKPSMKSKLLGTLPPTQASQHMPQQGIPKQDSSMHHPLTDISTPPFFHPLPPFRFPPFLKVPLPMLLASRHQQSSFKNLQ